MNVIYYTYIVRINYKDLVINVINKLIFIAEENLIDKINMYNIYIVYIIKNLKINTM